MEEIFSNKPTKERIRPRSRSTGRQSAKLFSSLKEAQLFQNK